MGRVCNGPSLLWAEMSSYHVIVTPVNGRFAQNVSLRRPYQERILLFLCLQINISAKVKRGNDLFYHVCFHVE